MLKLEIVFSESIIFYGYFGLVYSICFLFDSFILLFVLEDILGKFLMKIIFF